MVHHNECVKLEIKIIKYRALARQTHRLRLQLFGRQKRDLVSLPLSRARPYSGGFKGLSNQSTGSACVRLDTTCI